MYYLKNYIYNYHNGLMATLREFTFVSPRSFLLWSDDVIRVFSELDAEALADTVELGCVFDTVTDSTIDEVLLILIAGIAVGENKECSVVRFVGYA